MGREFLGPTRWGEDDAAVVQHGQPGEVAGLVVADDHRLDQPLATVRGRLAVGRFNGTGLSGAGISPQQDGDACADARPESGQDVFVVLPGVNRHVLPFVVRCERWFLRKTRPG